MTQNLWDGAKAVLRGKFITIQSYFKKQETSQINNLTLHLKDVQSQKIQSKFPLQGRGKFHQTFREQIILYKLFH